MHILLHYTFAFWSFWRIILGDSRHHCTRMISSHNHYVECRLLHNDRARERNWLIEWVYLQRWLLAFNALTIKLFQCIYIYSPLFHICFHSWCTRSITKLGYTYVSLHLKNSKRIIVQNRRKTENLMRISAKTASLSSVWFVWKNFF